MLQPDYSDVIQYSPHWMHKLPEFHTEYMKKFKKSTLYLASINPYIINTLRGISSDVYNSLRNIRALNKLHERQEGKKRKN